MIEVTNRVAPSAARASSAFEAFAIDDTEVVIQAGGRARREISGEIVAGISRKVAISPRVRNRQENSKFKLESTMNDSDR
ncbi:MAG: hypothetical protein ABI640_16355 [Gammaproteobacteria bacterium]